LENKVKGKRTLVNQKLTKILTIFSDCSFPPKFSGKQAYPCLSLLVLLKNVEHIPREFLQGFLYSGNFHLPLQVAVSPGKWQPRAFLPPPATTATTIIGNLLQKPTHSLGLTSVPAASCSSHPSCSAADSCSSIGFGDSINFTKDLMQPPMARLSHCWLTN
jgi:hypothetical protein